MVEKKKPTYVSAESVEPMQRIFALFQVVSVSPIATSKTPLFEVKLADKTGTLTLILKEQDPVDVC